MVRPATWNEYEAALLLDAYLKVLRGEKPRMDSVKECSAQLRQMALNAGEVIDDIYRNVNGISFQMSSMESAYQGRTIMKPATRLFTQTVYLYRNDTERFQKILMEAKAMVSEKGNIEAMFMSWLSENVSEAQLSELYMALREIENQAKKDKLVRSSLYESIDPVHIKRIKNSLEGSRIFKFTHKRQWRRILSALNYLLKYVAQESNLQATLTVGKAIPKGICVQKESVPIHVEKAFDDVAQTKDLLEGETSGSTKLSGNQIELNFEDIGTITFSKPVSLSYFGEVKKETTWKGMYVDACKYLLDDYPHVFEKFREESLNGSGKTWLVDEGHLQLLAVPKKVQDGYYVETNRSASDLVKNLKWILNECAVDYENIVILYLRGNVEETSSKVLVTDALPPQNKSDFQEVYKSFWSWLKYDQHMPEGTCRSYISAIRSAERFAEEHGLASYELYTSDHVVAKATADELFTKEEFIQYNNDQHNRFRAAITKLLAFYGSNWSPAGPEPRAVEPRLAERTEVSIDLTPYTTILVKHFPKGYRLESLLDMKRLSRYYEEVTGTSLDLDPAEVKTAIRDCGIVYDGKLYMPQNMLSEEMKEQILSFIDRCFKEGRPAVYYEAIFREFSEELLDHNIYNAEMLKAYLTYYISDTYYIGRSYLSTEVSADVDPADEVRQCLKQYDAPVQVEELCDSLPHITEDRVRFILGSNGEFVRNSKGEYFHADSLDLTEEELENIAAIIDSAIEEHEFISGNELYEAIQNKYPYTFEKNAVFSVIGWRDALKYKLADRFSFVGNIISRSGTSLSMSDVFTKYAKGCQRFSLDELEQFADCIGTTIYFDSLYTNAIRISHKWFTLKETAKFSVKETDAVLERFCDGNYIPLQEVKEFAIFPEASFPWTEYLLEQYVAFFSEKFYLMHGNYNKNCAVGAIVRKTCHFDSFDELVTDILAHIEIPLQKKEVLDYLTENGYIARRSYTNIEALMITARAMRNQKEK